MSLQVIPEQYIFTCDLCKKVCDSTNAVGVPRKNDGKVILHYLTKNYTSWNDELHLCDFCLAEVRDFLQLKAR